MQISKAPMQVCKCGEVQDLDSAERKKARVVTVCVRQHCPGSSTSTLYTFSFSWAESVFAVCHTRLWFLLYIPQPSFFSFFPLPSFIFEYFTPLVIKEAFSLHLLDSWHFDLPDRGGTNNITNYRTALIAGAELSMQLVPPFVLL